MSGKAPAGRRSGQSRGLVLILDEIQTIPRWSNVVKGLWDGDRRSRRPLKTVILGSAPWSLLTGLHESLAGRFDPLPVAHWSFREMARAFDFTLDEYLFLGGYPGSVHGRPGTWNLDAWQRHIVRAITTPAIDRDIVQLTRIRKPALMRQLMDLAPRHSGQIMSYNKLLGQLRDAGNVTTVAQYLGQLSDAGLITGLGRYAPSPHRSRAASPKLNVLNTALMTAVSGYSMEQAMAASDYWGRVVESAVGAHLWNTRGVATRIHYWRDRARRANEVDFVVERGPHLLGIEVKSGRRGGRTAGLDAFAKRFPHAKTLVVGTGGLPFNEFLSLDAEEWLNET